MLFSIPKAATEATWARGINGFSTLGSATSPHCFHIWVVLPSKELVAAVSPHNIFVYRELYFTPEILLLVWSHWKPENWTATGVCWHNRNMIATRNKQIYFSFNFKRKTISVQFSHQLKKRQEVCLEEHIFCPKGLLEGASWVMNGMTRHAFCDKFHFRSSWKCSPLLLVGGTPELTTLFWPTPN